MVFFRNSAIKAFTLLILGSLAGCGPNIYDEIALMPSPTVHAETDFDPFTNVTQENVVARAKLFYATDRMPVTPGDPQAYYKNERGYLLRTGVASVKIDPPLSDWQEILSVTLSAARNDAYTLSLSNVQEFGVMPFSITDYLEQPPLRADMEVAGRQFSQQINAQLAASPTKDIFVYVHGYNVDFDYPTLVSKELQHFLGYQGAFISYNWAATPSRFAYFRDLETASTTRRNLRSLIEFLSETTDVDRVHLIGYSAGSRLAFEVAYQIALQPEPKPSLGHLVLIGSDLDNAHFLQAVEDALLDVVTDETLYQSQTDTALAASRLVFGRERVGQTTQGAMVGSAARARLASLENLHIIDVTDAEAANTGNGHWYFQSSPWASSDLFITLLSDLNPRDRGLVRAPGEFLWQFPPNYPEVLQNVAKRL
ncbi:MAG: alpha/beta hydrolase [Dinoroseobacter sp.]|nr:alpha/beta hydrolase [Dinoroseobacter sp.]